MDLINYQVQLQLKGLEDELPKSIGGLGKGVEVYNKKKHLRKGVIAHAHFIKGIQVYDTNCKYCKGMPKPKKTLEEIAARKKMKYQYYLAWKHAKINI